MSKDKIRLFYILSLLILGSIIVLFAQGVLSGLSESSSKPVAEISRIDMYDDLYGNYSKISVFLANNDTISHNFSINTYYAEELKHSLNKKARLFSIKEMCCLMRYLYQKTKPSTQLYVLQSLWYIWTISQNHLKKPFLYLITSNNESEHEKQTLDVACYFHSNFNY